MTDEGITTKIVSAVQNLNLLLADYKYKTDKEILCNLKVLTSECKTVNILLILPALEINLSPRMILFME